MTDPSLHSDVKLRAVKVQLEIGPLGGIQGSQVPLPRTRGARDREVTPASKPLKRTFRVDGGRSYRNSGTKAIWMLVALLPIDLLLSFVASDSCTYTERP